jgi:ATP-dependent helicase/nuclease subunit A
VVPPCRIRVISSEELSMLESDRQMSGSMRSAVLETGIFEGALDKELYRDLSEAFERRYAHPEYAQLYTKTTVTELKKAAQGEEDGDSVRLFAAAGSDREYVPAFIRQDTAEGRHMTGAVRGTVYHRVMELLDTKIFSAAGLTGDLAKDQASGTSLCLDGRTLQNWMQDKENEGMLEAGSVRTADPDDILKFMNSNLGRRLGSACLRSDLVREHQFMLGLSASRLGKDLPDSETVLIQGIIDAYFYEGNEIVLLDYKTDRVRTGRELADRYKVQLDYYQEALERLTHRRVKERYLYSFALGEAVEV